MRTIALLLVIANLVFFAWQYPQHQLIQQQALSVTETDPVSTDNESPQSALMMLKELPRLVAEKVVTVDLDQGSGVTAGQDDRADQSPGCWTLGPFLTIKAADDGLSRLTASSIKGRTVEVVQQGVAGYRVLLPELASNRLAQTQMKKLKAKGIRDIAVLSIDDGYVVALGFFSRKTSAQQRVKEIVALGYEPSIEAVSRAKSIYSIELYRIADPEVWERAWQKLHDSYPDIKREPRKCT